MSQPITLSYMTDQMMALKHRKGELNKEIALLDEQYKDLEIALTDRLRNEGLTSFRTEKARITLSEQDTIVVDDWEAFHNYIHENHAFHLLRRQAASMACKEHTTLYGEPPPGTHLITLPKLTPSKP